MGKKSHNLTLSSIKLKLCSINLEISFFRKIATACSFHTNNYYSIPHNSMTGQMGSNVKDILFTRRFMTVELKKNKIKTCQLYVENLIYFDNALFFAVI